MATSNEARVPQPPTSKAYRFVNRDHRVGYVACRASGEPTPGGTFYARCPACGVMLAITPRGTLPRHKAAARAVARTEGIEPA